MQLQYKENIVGEHIVNLHLNKMLEIDFMVDTLHCTT